MNAGGCTGPMLFDPEVRDMFAALIAEMQSRFADTPAAEVERRVQAETAAVRRASRQGGRAIAAPGSVPDRKPRLLAAWG
ncbi:MAG TPA: hypothetical protein VKV26_25670 [Dehalococcoidia bacterium]|nr:hypothetical protein [Dehalococcoidia bacterium]